MSNIFKNKKILTDDISLKRIILINILILLLIIQEILVETNLEMTLELFYQKVRTYKCLK